MYCCILICRFMHKHNDTMKTSDTVLLEKIYLSLYLKVLCVRRSWRPNKTVTYWPPLLCPSALCLSRSPGLLTAGCWLSLSHLVTNRSDLQTNWLPVFTSLFDRSIALSISPHNWPLGCVTSAILGMAFDCHRAEITVMQFTGHSLPVHQSMTVPRDFTLSHIVSQTRPRQWNMHFRRLWNGMFGGVEGQYTAVYFQTIDLQIICLTNWLHTNKWSLVHLKYQIQTIH